MTFEEKGGHITKSWEICPGTRAAFWREKGNPYVGVFEAAVVQTQSPGSGLWWSRKRIQVRQRQVDPSLEPSMN